MFDRKSKEMCDIIEKKSVLTKDDFYVVNTPDFELIYDILDDRASLMWITKKTKNFVGVNLFKGLILHLKNIEIQNITAWGVKGYINKKQGVGYYVLLKWGFIPDKGINFINKNLNTKYKNFIEAYSDPNFLENWKINGTDFTGEFLLSDKSISMKQISKF